MFYVIKKDTDIFEMFIEKFIETLVKHISIIVTFTPFFFVNIIYFY